MECKITSTRQRAIAMTLIEVLVATTLAVVLLGAVAITYAHFLRSFAGLEHYMSMDARGRRTLDSMSKEIRQATRLVSYATNALTFQFPTNQVSYVYNSGARTLTRSASGQSSVLLSNCDSLRYDIFQRNTTNGSYDLYPTAIATNCKVVQITWTCSGTILGAKRQTENFQSAKVVMRNQKK